MVGGLQGEEWKFIQKYLKKRSKRVGAQISHFACRFRTLHGDLRKSRKLISQLGIYFRTLSSTFASCKITFASWASLWLCGCIPFPFHKVGFNFARWSSNFAIEVPILQGAKLSLNLVQLSSEGHIFLTSAPNRNTVWSVGFLTSWFLKWYIACRKWTLGSAPKVRKKTADAVLCFLHSVFPLSVVLSLHTLNDFCKGLWSSKTWFFMNLSFQKLCHELYIALPHSWIALV